MPSAIGTKQHQGTTGCAARPWPRAACFAAAAALLAGAPGCDSDVQVKDPAPPPVGTEGLRRCRPASGVLNTNEEIQSFAGCQVLEGSLQADNPVTDLSPLSSLRVIEGNFTGVRDEPIPLEALDELEVVGGDVKFYYESVTSLQGLVKLREVGGWLGLREVAELKDLRGLERVRSLTKLHLVENPQLRTLDGLDGLEVVTGNVVIRDNPLLPSSEVDALLARIEVGGTITR